MLFELAALLLSIPQVGASDQSQIPPLAIVPIETELQRKLLGVKEVPGDPKLLPRVLWIRLEPKGEKSLEETVEQVTSALSTLALVQKPPIYVNLEVGDVENAVVDRLQTEIGTILENSGLTLLNFRCSYSSQREDWSATRAGLLAAAAADAGALEDENLGDRRVRLHEVHTSLARTLLSGSDLWVSLRGPLNVQNGWLEPEALGFLHERLADQPRRRQKLFWNVERWYAEERDWGSLQKELDAVAHELGFEECTLSASSPESPRAEALVGQPAPDFTLERLAPQEPMEFRAATTGKVVLLSFWGVG